jgi:hypothetical protein
MTKFSRSEKIAQSVFLFWNIQSVLRHEKRLRCQGAKMEEI